MKNRQSDETDSDFGMVNPRDYENEKAPTNSISIQNFRPLAMNYLSQ